MQLSTLQCCSGPGCHLAQGGDGDQHFTQHRPRHSGCRAASLRMITHLAQGGDDDEHIALHHVEVPPRRRPPLPHQRLRWEARM